MTTFAEFRTAVARDLRDPSYLTFVTDDLADMINEALSEIGRIAPQRFQEDITPVADTLEYIVRSAYFDGEANPEIELARVEIWDGSKSPPLFIAKLTPSASEYVSQGDTGWWFFGGILHLSNSMETAIDPDIHLIRVWGYSPYRQMDDDANVVEPSAEAQWAMRAYCRIAGLQRLSFERDLFTQWQTRSNNTDVSPAALMNALSIAQEDWRRRERKLMVLRQT